jgi:hypothetical protein
MGLTVPPSLLASADEVTDVALWHLADVEVLATHVRL